MLAIIVSHQVHRDLIDRSKEQTDVLTSPEETDVQDIPARSATQLKGSCFSTIVLLGANVDLLPAIIVSNVSENRSATRIFAGNSKVATYGVSLPIGDPKMAKPLRSMDTDTNSRSTIRMVMVTTVAYRRVRYREPSIRIPDKRSTRCIHRIILAVDST